MGQSRAGWSTRRVEGFDVFDAGIRSVWRRPEVQKGVWVEGMERQAQCLMNRVLLITGMSFSITVGM